MFQFNIIMYVLTIIAILAVIFAITTESLVQFGEFGGNLWNSHYYDFTHIKNCVLNSAVFTYFSPLQNYGINIIFRTSSCGFNSFHHATSNF